MFDDAQSVIGLGPICGLDTPYIYLYYYYYYYYY